MLMFVLDPAAFGGLERFQAEVSDMVDYLHSATAAAGVDKVRIPGEPERESVAARTKAGIPIDDNSWMSISKAAQAAGLSEIEIDRLTA